MDYMALYGSRTEALRKLTLVTGDLVVWTMLPAFLRALWWGTEDSRGPRGRDPRGGAWKGSTGKWASLCRSRAAGHAPRLPSSFLFAGGSRPAAGERRDGRKNTRRRVPAALQTRQPPHFFFLSLSLSLSLSLARSLARSLSFFLLSFPLLSFSPLHLPTRFHLSNYRQKLKRTNHR